MLIRSDSDAAIRALLEAHAEVRDVEIAGAGLEQAFVELTADRHEPTAAAERPEALV